jgi:hypothetical protein
MITTMDLAITPKPTDNVSHQKHGDMKLATPTISNPIIAKMIMMIMWMSITSTLMRNGTMLTGLALYQTLMGSRLHGTGTAMETISSANLKIHGVITLPTQKHLKVMSTDLT